MGRHRLFHSHEISTVSKALNIDKNLLKQSFLLCFLAKLWCLGLVFCGFVC